MLWKFFVVKWDFSLKLHKKWKINIGKFKLEVGNWNWKTENGKPKFENYNWKIKIPKLKFEIDIVQLKFENGKIYVILHKNR